MSAWRKGPPPAVGWWPASMFKDSDILRFWNGRCWSEAAIKGYAKADVNRVGSMRPPSQHDIEWLPRPKSWPDHARFYGMERKS